MKLPEKFQFRHHEEAGFTHTAKKLENGDCYKVRWARGWNEHLLERDGNGQVSCTMFCHSNVEDFVELGAWSIVDEKKSQEEALPDVMYFKTYYGDEFVLVRDKTIWRCWHVGRVGEAGCGAAYTAERIQALFNGGHWERYEPNILTPEQQRFNKEFRERIFALNNSIKIQQQTVEHHQRMIANYEGQIKDLEAKIVEV